MSASARSPSRCASEWRLSTSMPQPSPQPVPSAVSAKLLQRPSAASPRKRLNSMNTTGETSSVTPPLRATSHSPRRKPVQAKCSATSDDEHAVSTVSDGPCNPSTYDTRPDTTLTALLVIVYPSRPAKLPACDCA